MTLEDFFTLAEMKDGLTAPSRVEELVTVMWKEKHSDIVKNIGDATRQWAAVAGTITATDNKDCLELFIKLDGLCFIDRWLKDASKFSADTSDGLVEESLTALLQAVEKLHIGNERSVASGIFITVKNLLNHKSSQVQDRAKALFDSWKLGTVDDKAHIVVESVEEFNVSLPESEIVKPECVDVDNSVSKGNGNGEHNSAEPTRSVTLVSSAVDSFKQEVAEDRDIPTHNQEPCFNVTCDQKKVKDRSPNLLTSSVQESTSVKEASPTGTMEGTTADDSKQGTAEVQPEVLKSNEISNDEKPVLKLNTVPEKLSTGASFSSATRDGEVSCGNNVAIAQDGLTEPTSQNNIDDVGDVRTPASVPKVGIDGIGSTCRYSGHISKTDGESGSDVFHNLSTTECRLGKTEHMDTSFSQMEDDGVSEEDKEHSSYDEDEDVRNFAENSRSRIYARSPEMIDERSSDMELEYGIVDALEVARQVAQAVEREVVDYRERSCSSSMEKTTEKGVRQPGSPDSVDEKRELPADIPPRDMPTGQTRHAESHPEDEQLAKNTLDNLCSELGGDKHDVETSHVTEAAQESEGNTEKGLCDFDLNQEVDSDETEHIANPISAPISVPASRPIAASGSSVAPFQFEGNLGWKGSAATSAFRPASPRRISNHKTLPPGETSSSFSHGQFSLEFDLNVADGGDDKIPEMTGKEIPGSSALHTADSCLEASPIKSERHKLDLNLTSDDSDAPPSELRIEGRLFHSRNGHHSVSPASSSSSMQPSARNFDLNDRPYLLNDSTSDQGYFLGKSSQSSRAYGGPKPDDPVISIMGTRVEVSRKNFMPQTTSLPNGKALDTAMDAITAREGGILGMAPTVSYTQSNVFGYNGLTTAPTMSFSSTMYGPGPGSSFPYMVDSRGTPVVPQVVGSASVVPPFSHAPLWLSPMNGVAPLRPNFDLNSGFTVEGANRDSGVFRQFLMPVQSGPMEEHLRTSSQPSSSSGVGGKRKEPDDGGWEPFPFNYRNQQPPWR
ncbi:Transcription elongation factor family protein putative isoform 1 [Tripterygium wilfordii]|uniref:Transcription elongation factor family protein putative isoform 1 n=1 Tax=Tripterygium wilfordii TaxID=458696 RepID=A0A7J7D3P0_TRIWF|nr:uncharacterized protein LOC120009303 [Tripterygium wilfordii]KAF5740879.1 Transcription elongation factor family protein putative isoform 1 [Tripterygium wilfordii]